MRSSKLDPMLICFDEKKFGLKVAMSIAYELPWCLHWSCHDMFYKCQNLLLNVEENN